MNILYFKYLTALFLFGSNGIVASMIPLSSREIVLLRTLLGSALLIVLFFLKGRRLNIYGQEKAFFYLMMSGIGMGGSWLFLYEAYDRIGVSLASLAYYCGPVIVMLLSPLLLGEAMTKRTLFSFLTVLIGIFLVNGTVFEGGGDPTGLLCGLLSALCYAAMVIFSKKSTAIKGLENAMLQLVCAFLTVAVFVGITQGFRMDFSPTNLPPILTLGLLNTGLGCYFYFSSIGTLPVRTVTVCGYLEPLSAVVFSVLFLREPMLPVQALGAVLILGGAVFGELMSRNA